MASKVLTKFGASARNDFLFAKDFLNLNHGSFGTYPRVIRDELRRFQDEVEAKPDVFIRYDYPRLLDEAREAIAGLLNVDVAEVVFVQNATTGINTILHNLVYAPNDFIIYFATIYGACEKTIAYIEETTPAQSFKIDYSYPVSDDFLVSRLEAAITNLRAQGRNPRVAVFDSVVSMPGVRMPYERLTEVCRRTGVLSCIDAAHAVGMLSRQELDMGRLKPDFLVSNCHKWLFVPRGCAVLYVPLRNQHLIRTTLPTSHGFAPLPKPGVAAVVNPLPPNPKSAYVANFEFVGTIDNAPYLCLPAALKYRHERFGGEDAVAAHLVRLARRAGDVVARKLGTEVLENGEGTLRRCAFANVRLAISLDKVLKLAGFDAGTATQVEIETLGGRVRDWASLTLVREYGTFVALMFYGRAWWARLSAQVYLDEADFVRAGEMLSQVCQRVEAGEFLQPHSKL